MGRTLRRFFVLLAVGGLLGGLSTPAVVAATPITITVTDATDPGVGVCPPSCSLRQAIDAADANAGAHDLIEFAIPGGPADIVLGSALPPITDPVTIDGRTQPGTRLIGSALGGAADGLVVQGPAHGTVITGLEIREFLGHGILLDGVHDTIIGGDTAADGNVLTANALDGIAIIGDGTSVGNDITANRISGNGSLSIDLGDDDAPFTVGNPIGGPPLGPNELANGPTIAGPLLAPLSTVSISVGRRAYGGDARVDVFWSPTCPLAQDASFSIRPQAAEFLGSATATVVPSFPVDHYADVTFPISPSRDYGFITATSTTGYGTSEVGGCVPIDAATDLAAAAVATPGASVPVGDPVHVDLTASNLGPAFHSFPLAGLFLVGGTADLLSATSPEGSCAIDPGVAVYCILDPLAPGAMTTVGIDLAPTTAGTLDLAVGVEDPSGLDPDPLNNFVNLSITVLADEDVSGSVPPGGTISTDGESDGATPADPVETTITVPGGTESYDISIAERGDPTPPPAGYAFAGQAVVITANPPATAADPFVFEFLIDSSSPGAVEPIVVFRNGVPVPPCTVPADPSATPDPCYLPHETVGDDIRITVRTSAASVWRFGYVLPYSFEGFFAPVNNNGVLNRVKAGSAVPVKFSLGGDRGLDIFAPSSPGSQVIACGGGPVDAIEHTVSAGSSSLTYDHDTDRYHYVWKTSKSWAGTCRRLVLTFADGTTQSALFDFTR